MTATEIEQRFKRIEQELAELRAERTNVGISHSARTPVKQTAHSENETIIPPTSPNYWIEETAGMFSDPKDQAAFDEAMRYGRKWRNAQRPKQKRRALKKK